MMVRLLTKMNAIVTIKIISNMKCQNRKFETSKTKIETVGSQFGAQAQQVCGLGPKGPETMNL